MSKTSHRREKILQLLLEQQSVQVIELAEQFAVSTVTIRNDLSFFEGQGLVTRTYGGAYLQKFPVPEQNIQQKDELNHSLKQRIAARAAELVRTGDNIILDSGTTTSQLARSIRDMQDVTVMTSGLNVAWELVEASGVEVMLTGGVLRKKSLSFQGMQAESSLSRYRFDKLFLGVDGFDIEQGITTHNEAEASLNRKMVEVASEVIVVTDSSKFGSVCLHRIISLSQVDKIITDDQIAPDYLKALQDAGVEVILVA